MSRRRSGRRRQAGISLVEVLVAMTLFALVATGMAAMAATSLRATSDSRAASAAHVIAQQRLEFLRSLDYDDIASGTDVVGMIGEDYQVTTSVFPNDPDDGMKRIRVRVGWTGALGPRTYELQTIYTAIR